MAKKTSFFDTIANAAKAAIQKAQAKEKERQVQEDLNQIRDRKQNRNSKQSNPKLSSFHQVREGTLSGKDWLASNVKSKTEVASSMKKNATASKPKTQTPKQNQKKTFSFHNVRNGTSSGRDWLTSNLKQNTGYFSAASALQRAKEQATAGKTYVRGEREHHNWYDSTDVGADRSFLSNEDYTMLQTYKKDWEEARSRGDQEGMRNAHQLAEDIRKRYGYLGGANGGAYNIIAEIESDEDVIQRVNRAKQAQEDLEKTLDRLESQGMRGTPEYRRTKQALSDARDLYTNVVMDATLYFQYLTEYNIEGQVFDTLDPEILRDIRKQVLENKNRLTAQFMNWNKNESEIQQLEEQEQAIWQAIPVMESAQYTSIRNRDDFDAKKAPVYDEANPTANYINDMPGVREKFQNSTVFTGLGAAIKDEWKTMEYMTQDERDMYNYILNTQGVEDAGRYLEFVEDVRNQRRGQAVAQDMEGKPVLQALYGFKTGLERGFQGVAQLFSAEPLGYRYTQYAGQAMREDLGPIGRGAYDILNAAGNMAPTLLTSFATGGLGAPAAITTAAGGFMTALSSGGNTYNEMVMEGYTPEQAQSYGAMMGALEGGLQYALGGITGAVGKIPQSIGAKVSGLENGVTRFALNQMGNMASEGMEEGIQEFLGPVVASLVLDEEYVPAEMEDIVYSALLGALTAGVMDVPGGIANEVNTRKAGNTIRSLGQDTIDRFISIGTAQEVGSPVRRLAERLSEKQAAGEMITPYQLGQLWRDVKDLDITSGLSEQNTDGELVYADETEAYQQASNEASDLEFVMNSASSPQNESYRESDSQISNLEEQWSEANRETHDAREEPLVRLAREMLEDQEKDQRIPYQDRIPTDEIEDAYVYLDAYLNGGQLENRSSADAGGEVNAFHGDRALQDTAFQMQEERQDMQTNQELQLASASQMFGPQGQRIAPSLYNGDVDIDTYYGGFAAYYQAGVTGKEMETVKSVYSNALNDAQKQAAYLAGMIDGGSARPNQSLAQNERILYNQTNETDGEYPTTVSIEGESEYGGEEIYLRDSSQRAYGSDSGRSISFMEKGAGSNQSRKTGDGPADSGAASLTYGRKVSSASLGIGKGSATKDVRLVRSGSTPAVQRAKQIARKEGLTLVLFGGGNLTIDGESVNGYLSNGRVFVRADHPYYTADQIMRHEAGHSQIAKGSIDPQAVRERLSTHSKEALDRASELYAQAYDGTNLTPEEIWEEVICDSLGDMNLFADTRLEGEMDGFLQDVKQNVQNAKAEMQNSRGPPAEYADKSSRERRKGRSQRGRSIEMETMENNRFERLRSFQDELPEIWYAVTRDYFYLYSNHSFTDYTVVAKTSITDGNKAAIDAIIRELNDGIDRTTEIFDSWFADFQRRKGRHHRNRFDSGNTRATVPNGGMDDRARGSSFIGHSEKDGGDYQQNEGIAEDTGEGKASRELRRYQEDADAFAQDIQTWDREGRADGETFILGSTSQVLQGLGAMEHDIYMLSEKVNTILKEHPEMTLEEIQRIPDILNDPVLILKSKGAGKRRQNSRLVIFGTVKAQNGKPVLSILDLMPYEGKLRINDMQKVNSSYTKSGNAGSFIMSSDVLYADQKRTIPLLRSVGLAITSRQLLRHGSMGSITYQGNRVNIEGKPFSSVVESQSEGSSRDLKTIEELRKSNRALKQQNDSLKERVEYWKNQTKITRHVTMDQKAVAKTARELIQETGASVDRKKITQDLQNLYDYIARGNEGSREFTYTEARRQAEKIGYDLVENSVSEGELYREYKPLRDYVKDHVFQISKEDQAGIADFSDFRKNYFGTLSVKTGETNVDQIYQEMAFLWPEFFDEQRETHPADQLLQIAEIMDTIRQDQKTNLFFDYYDQAAEGLANEIMERFFDLPQAKKTFADIQDAKLRQEKARGRERVKAVRDQKNEKINLLRQENRERIREAVKKERARREREIENLRKKYRETNEERRERQSARELRAKIQRHTQDLSRKLLRPTDKQHIPEELRLPVAELLRSINLESQYRVDPETGRRSKSAEGLPVKRTQAFLDLKDAYSKIIARGGDDMVIDPSLFGSHTDGIQGMFDEVSSLSDTPIASMHSEQLRLIWDVIRAVESSISSAGKTLASTKYQRTVEWAEAFQSDTHTRRQKNRGYIDMETPMTFFSHFGNAGESVYQMLRDAQDKRTTIFSDIQKEVQHILPPGTDIRKLQRTAHTFHLQNGDITLTTAHLMNLYATYRREQGKQHLLFGGIVQPEIKSKRVRAKTDAIRLTESDLNTMFQSLTEDQKKLTEDLQALLSGKLAEYGNEASMKAYGYQKFMETNYWPLKVASSETRSEVEKHRSNVRSIANIGMAKNMNPNAANAVTVGDVFDVFSAHVNDMASYASYLCPMEDVNRLYNFRFRELDADGNLSLSGKTVKGILDRVGGPKARMYWENLMADIQNDSRPQDTETEHMIGRIVGNTKAAAVGANIRVVIQQPTAMLRASIVLDPVHMAQGIVKGATKGNGWEKALRYAPIAQWKDWGSFDIGRGTKLSNILFRNESAKDRMMDAFGALAGKADIITWGRIWNACEWQVKSNQPSLRAGSEAFYTEVSKLFSKVINESQVVDGVLQRSQIMRSDSSLMKQASSFMGEPTMAYNMLSRAWDKVRFEQDPKKRGKAIKKLGRTAVALLITDFVNAAAQSVVDALRDDDRDKKYTERWVSAFTGITGEEKNWVDVLKSVVLGGNVVNNMNPIGRIPFAKDVLSIVQGFDVSRMDTEILKDIIQTAETFLSVVSGNGNKTIQDSLLDLLNAGAKLFGIPASTIKRDLIGIVRFFAVQSDNLAMEYQLEKFVYQIGSEKNQNRFAELLYEARESGQNELYEQMYQDLMDAGMSPKDIESRLNSIHKKSKAEGYLANPTSSEDVFSGIPLTISESKNDSWLDEATPREQKEYYSHRSKYYDELLGVSDDLDISGLDAETVENLVSAMSDMADGLAKRKVDPDYEMDEEPQWIQRAILGGDLMGYSTGEAALYHVAYQMATGSDNDGDGKIDSGTRAEEAAAIFSEWFPEKSAGEISLVQTVEQSEPKELKDLSMEEKAAYYVSKGELFDQIMSQYEENDTSTLSKEIQNDFKMDAASFSGKYAMGQLKPETVQDSDAKRKSNGVYSAYDDEYEYLIDGMERGMNLSDLLLFESIYDETEGEKDKSGNTIRNTKKKNVLARAEKEMPWLTQEEMDYMRKGHWAK